MSITDKTWYIMIGESQLGALHPTGSDDEWYYADFEMGNSWGNFAPWFDQALAAYRAGDTAGWENLYAQLSQMGLALVSADGERLESPTLFVEGQDAFFVV